MGVGQRHPQESPLGQPPLLNPNRVADRRPTSVSINYVHSTASLSRTLHFATMQQGRRLATVLSLYVTATLLVLQDTHGLLDSYRAYGSWNSYSTCDMFQAPEPDPSGSPHEATCAAKLLIVTNATILGQTIACDGETATTHGKDFLYMELAQQGAVVTRLAGVHRARGVYTFPDWHAVRPRCPHAREQ